MSGECEHCGQHPVDGDCFCNTPVVLDADSEIPSWAREKARVALDYGQQQDIPGRWWDWEYDFIEDRLARALVAAWEAGRAQTFVDIERRLGACETGGDMVELAEWCHEQATKGDKP